MYTEKPAESCAPAFEKTNSCRRPPAQDVVTKQVMFANTLSQKRRDTRICVSGVMVLFNKAIDRQSVFCYAIISDGGVIGFSLLEVEQAI